MFSEISASKFFEVLDALDFVIVFFGDPKYTERVTESSDIDPEFRKPRIIIILNDKWNAVNFNSILINSVDIDKLISEAFFVSPSSLKGEEGNVVIK